MGAVMPQGSSSNSKTALSENQFVSRVTIIVEGILAVIFVISWIVLDVIKVSLPTGLIAIGTAILGHFLGRAGVVAGMASTPVPSSSTNGTVATNG